MKKFWFARNTTLCAVVFLGLGLARAIDFPPVTPEQLAMKDNPAQPGAKAMILYRAIERDDRMGSQAEYAQIKIFTQEGKDYGDVVLDFDRGAYTVESIKGRTIHPDGTVIPFNGKAYEKVIAEGQGFKVHRKAFTMPDVTPGSVLEYKYVVRWEASDPATHQYYYFPRSEWEVSKELYQQSAHFVFKPLTMDGLYWSLRSNRLPPDAKFNHEQLTDKVTLDLVNVPGVEKEEFMPPSSETKARVLFFYSDTHIPEPDQYWKDHGKKWHGWAEGFMDKKGAIQKDLASVISSSDSTDVKLRKIYEHVQSFENLEFESAKSDKEIKALKIRDIKSIEDVINGKAGYRNELNRTFVALARGAGFDATLVAVTERDTAIFHKEWPSSSQLAYEIPLVKVNGADIYLDPGSPFCPFGVVPWEDTAVSGLKLDKNPPVWAQIPLPPSDDSSIKRVAKMTLGDDGSLTGEVEVTFTGQDAFHHRLWERNEDDAGKKKDMEELLQDWMALKADIELEKVNDWKASNVPLVATFKVTVAGYASQAGKRVLIPCTLFAAAYRNPFTPTKRVNPIIMHYAYDRSDDVTIKLPANFQVESMPKPVAEQNNIADLNVKCDSNNGTLHLVRDFKLKGLFIDQKYYGAVRGYFQQVQAGANEQAVLKMGN
ncbi:hypothetical protein Acid345_0540 [Candidatus Koribacter versatilis Ellin345]|uniref:DUF3857 domain-containing protein n=1 Tax=Koribacter versatilis (strain Ellin345) TaxID=204669 RepID=Q1IUA5_KORVE|nr:DUF3857 domain-containing protein [Candidatus Koribacter versatilis]ABF39545.1 hypothetical protein Acid345_0540 [Candidatus Koribacter versatilis Ellin345]